MKFVRFILSFVLAFVVGVMATTVTTAESPPEKAVCFVQETRVQPEFKTEKVKTTNQALRRKDDLFTYNNRVLPNYCKHTNFVQLE